jgi:geranylgeranyl reductase family protein
VNHFDVAIVGAGPAGSTCAALCAAAGLRTLVLEKAVFPRDKVCGDCINPACWPVLDRLGVSGRIRALPHSRLGAVEFVGTDEEVLRYPLAQSAHSEIAVKRSLFDQALLERAIELGATVRPGVALTTLEPGWHLRAGDEGFFAPLLVAADGRNSTVARLRGLLPAAHRDRIGLQTHLPAPADFGEKVRMSFLPHGYCGVASVGGGELNVCLVARPQHLDQLKAWADARFAVNPNQAWRTITPLARPAARAADAGLLLVGDAARVIEPFTGEGIYYALASGALAADHLIRGDLARYAAAHGALYRGRLWINQLAKAAVLHPQLATQALKISRHWPGLLRLLTTRIVGATG